jgi:hypothetical protein
MSFEIKAEGVDVREVMADIRRRLEERKARGLVSDQEIREIAERRLHPIIDPHDFKSSLLPELLDQPERWNYSFDAETLYRSSRGTVGQLLEKIRRALGPVQKLFWNPNPMISALSRQADLNTYYVHLLHNTSAEMTRLALQVQNLTHRVLQLQGQLEFQARREKALEALLLEREGKDGKGPA